MDFDATLRSYNALLRVARSASDPRDREKNLETARQLHAMLMSDPERGDVVEPPSAPPTGKLQPTVRAGVTSLPPAELDRVRAVAESQIAPGANRDFAPNAAHGASAQPGGGGGVDASLLQQTADVRYQPKVAGATSDVAADVQPTAAPAPSDGGPLTLAEYAALTRSGGGARVDVRGAAAGADLASVNADAANQLERDAILRRGAQQESDGRQLGATMAEFASQLKARDEEHQAYLMQARERISGLIQESRQAAEEFRAATREQGFMQSLSSGGRVGAAISLALGALGGGLTGQGGNAALDVLKFRVDEDLRNRSLNIQAKGAALDAVDGLLQRNLQIFGDEISAREATRAAVFDALKLEVQCQSAISGGVDATNAAQQLVAGMDAEKARAEEVLANQQLQAMLKAARSGGTNLRKQLADWQAYLKNDLELRTGETKLQQLEGAGGKPDIYSEEGKRASDRLNRLQDKLKPYDELIRRGKDLLEDVGVPSVVTRARASYGSKANEVAESSALLAVPALITSAALSTLGPDENKQVSALHAYQMAKVRASQGGGQLSDRDVTTFADRELRASWQASQESIIAQVRRDIAAAERARADVLAANKDEAAVYEPERDRRAQVAPKRGVANGPRGGRPY